MEQIINPSANSEKYIKETDTKVKEFSDKIDSLEKQYISVIKSKDDEINAEKKKVNDISSSLNTIINSKDDIISELRSQINSMVKSDGKLNIRLHNNYIKADSYDNVRKLSNNFKLRKGAKYSIELSLYQLENKNCEVTMYVRDANTKIKLGNILKSVQKPYHDNAQTHNTEVWPFFEVPGTYSDKVYIECEVVLQFNKQVTTNVKGFTQSIDNNISFIDTTYMNGLMEGVFKDF